MFTYRNPITGRELERPTRDEWLERASWELLEEEPEVELEPQDDDERTE